MSYLNRYPRWLVAVVGLAAFMLPGAWLAIGLFAFGHYLFTHWHYND